jgi:hypothetical protein
MEALTIRGNWRWSFILVIVFAVALAAVGVLIIGSLLGWILLAGSAGLILAGLPYLIYSTGYELRADASGLVLLWRGRQRKAFPWPDVCGMAWVQRYVGKGMPEFFVVRTDGTTSRLPLPVYTKTGQEQVGSVIDYWRRAVPGLELLDHDATAPMPLRRAGNLSYEEWWYRALCSSLGHDHLRTPDPRAGWLSAVLGADLTARHADAWPLASRPAYSLIVAGSFQLGTISRTNPLPSCLFVSTLTSSWPHVAAARGRGRRGRRAAACASPADEP